MARYFFHIKDELKTIRDEEGTEFHDLDAVREEATEAAREIMSKKVGEGYGPNGRVFIVEDEQGRVVLTFPFKEAIRN